jgi:hypothetical protein
MENTTGIYTKIYGLIYECPYRHRRADCPLIEIDQLSYSEKLEWVESLSNKKIGELLEHHEVCFAERVDGN